MTYLVSGSDPFNCGLMESLVAVWNDSLLYLEVTIQCSCFGRILSIIALLDIARKL
jgi:hypothetical protein